MILSMLARSPEPVQTLTLAPPALTREWNEAVRLLVGAARLEASTETRPSESVFAAELGVAKADRRRPNPGADEAA